MENVQSYLRGIAGREARAVETWREESHVVAHAVLNYVRGNALLVHVKGQILTGFCALPGQNPFKVAAEVISSNYPNATPAHANHYIA